MKSIKQHITIFFILLCATNAISQEQNSILGYDIKGDTLIFIFDAEDYPNILNNGDPIRSVNVSGEFNNWATDKWPMERTGPSTYELSLPLNEFTHDFDWEFKFVVNGEHWAEPSEYFKNKIIARTKEGRPMHVYNLRLYTAFATEYGNVDFNLKGYQNAKEVLVTGTFNRWDETNFKMKRTKDGWKVTLQLSPDVYEYKFIVDGKWMSDPNNPSKTPNEYDDFNSVIDIQETVYFQLNNYLNAKKVILTGGFNNWSTESFKMQKENNKWTFSLPLSAGKYHYKFIVDGQWITDPNNSVKEYDDKGNINSVCMVK